MNNMGLFFKSNKDKKDIDPNKILKDIEKIKKDKNRNYSYTINLESPYGWGYSVTVTISRFGVFMDNVLLDPSNQKEWNDIKELYGKNVDEKELLKVFKFYIFIAYLADALDNSKNIVISNAKGSWGYNLYKDEYNFDGKLDQKAFMELLAKIGEYYTTKLAKNTGEKIDQKSEQPK